MTTDRTTFNLLIRVLGAALLLCIVGVITLTMTNHDIPSLLGELAVGALGVLGGLLVPHPGSGEPQAVQVVNPPDVPVQVEAAPEPPRTVHRRAGTRAGSVPQ